MPDSLTKRDLQLVIDHLKEVIREVDNLYAVQPDNILVATLGNLQVARLWLQEARDNQPESRS